MVTCRLCRKRMKQVTPSHLWHIHKTSTRVYRVMFPKAPMRDNWDTDPEKRRYGKEELV